MVLGRESVGTTDANSDEVVAIAEVAILAAPDAMRIISQCAIAANPDSIASIQTLLSQLDPNAGETGHSAKSAKSPKGAEIVIIAAPPLPNPLDRPYATPIIPIPPITNVNP